MLHSIILRCAFLVLLVLFLAVLRQYRIQSVMLRETQALERLGRLEYMWRSMERDFDDVFDFTPMTKWQRFWYYNRRDLNILLGSVTYDPVRRELNFRPSSRKGR